jgi:hypothetical protein
LKVLTAAGIFLPCTEGQTGKSRCRLLSARRFFRAWTGTPPGPDDFPAENTMVVEVAGKTRKVKQ